MDIQNKTNKELENKSARINKDSDTKFTPSFQKMPAKKSHILILAAIVIVILVTGGYLFYSYSAGQLRAEKENELKAIAELKTDQIVRWHKERIDDAKIISESPFFIKGIEELLDHKNIKPLSADILEILSSAKTIFGHEDIFLVSVRGDILLSNIQSEKKCETQILPDILEASGSGKITFTDFYFCPLHQTIHYDIIAPIKNNSNRIIAFLISRVDPYNFLYPLIQSWPTPSKSAEVLLIKKDGDSVLFLNELRHKKNTAVQLRIPLTRTDLPATQAILGKTGIFDGKDYRGIDVVAWFSPVPLTDWFMVSKVDKDEIFAGLNFIATIVFIVIVLLILALSIGMVWIYLYRQRNVYRNLWQVQEEFRATLYSIGDAVITTNIKGLITNMNPISETLCGWELKDALGKPLTEVLKIINSDTRKIVDNPVNLVLKNGKIVGLANHTILISKNGTEYQIADSAAPIKNMDGEIGGVVLVFSDVTKKYVAEKAIRDSEKYLKETQIIAQLGTYTLDINTGIWSSSEILDEIFGIEKNHDKSVNGWVSIIHPDWQKTMNDYFIEEVIGKKIKFDKEYQIIRKTNNEIRWVHGSGKLEFDEQGSPIKMVGTILDITERKQSENSLRQSNAFNKALLNTIPFGMNIVDETGTVLFLSDNFNEIYGESAIGKKCWELYKDDKKQCSDCPLFKGISVGETKESESHGVLGNRIFEISHTGMIYQGKKAMLEIFQDITEKKSMLDELIRAKQKAEESDKLKSAFLANMSHEIRTPMNGILGFAELLKEPELNGEQQQEYIRIIEKSGTRMLNIINDIVDISKIEAGLVILDIKEWDINEQIEYIYTFFKPEAKAKGLKFSFKNTLPAKEAIIKTDREKVFAILTNLVKNAIKYTNEGSVEFGYDKKGNYLVFYVKDTGISIPKDRQLAIFERFIQADILDAMAHQGAGLGLAIAKAYIEMLGGKIWLESPGDVGSTFYFTLPYNAEPEEKNVVGNSITSQEEKVQINPEVSGLKILIVEDDKTSEMLISINIKEFSKEIIEARTGNEAVEICRTNPDFDLILMDIQMPGLNGYAATQLIREFNKDVIIIAQTAFGLSGDREKAIEAGCNDYIAKPIKKDELLSLIQKYLKK